MIKKQLFFSLNRNRNLIILIFLLACSVYFAFYNYQYRYILDDETIRDAVISIEGARQKQAPMVGAFSSAGAFTFGPWFYYQLIIFSLLFPSFYSPWVMMGIAYIASVLILYLIGRELKDEIFGLILATLGTFSPALIIGAVHLTNPNLVTFYSLLSLYLFIKIVKKDVSYWWGFFFGVTLALGINIHYQTASLLVFPIIMAIYKRRRIAYISSFLIGFLIPFIPLLLFDLTNHWFNLKNFVFYYMYGKNAIYVPNRWLFYVRDFWPLFWSDVIGTPKLFGFGFMIATFFVLVYEFIKKKVSILILLVAVAFFVDFIAMRYYWGERFFGYFNFLRPFVFVFTGYVIYFVYKKIKYGRFMSVICLVALALVILPKTFDRLKSDPFNQEVYKRVRELEKMNSNQKFSLYICKDLYSGNDQKFPKSVLYILEKDGKIDPNGEKIGVEKIACIKKGKKKKIITKEGLSFADERKYPQILNTDIYNISGAQSSMLRKAGWETITFNSIYDSTTRWWFKEQP